MDKQATIETLKRLTSLISAREELDNLVSYEIDDQTSRNLADIRNKYFDWRGIPCPELVSKAYCFELVKAEEKRPASTGGFFRYVILAYVLVTITFLPQIIGWIGWFIGLAAIILWGFKLKANEKNECSNEKQKINTKEYEPVQSALQLYAEQAQQGIQKLEERKTLFPEAFAECLQEIETAEKRKAEVRPQIAELDREIAAIDLIAPKYYHLINTVVDLLETGRAADYKEALNAAIEQEEQDKHRKKLEAIEREKARKEDEQRELAKKRCENCQYQLGCQSKGIASCGRYLPFGHSEHI